MDEGYVLLSEILIGYCCAAGDVPVFTVTETEGACGELTVIVMLALAVRFWESVTSRVTVEAPAVVGVPLMTPKVSDNPAGSEPEVMLQVYGGVPPVAANACEKAAPTVADKFVPVVMEIGLAAEFTVIVMVLEAV